MRLSRLAFLAVIVVAGVAAGPQEAPKDSKGELKAGRNLPGPFHAFNVTGPRKGNFHCLVSEYGPDPTVLIIHRGLDVNDAFKSLVKQLDTSIEKYAKARLRAFVVFLNEDLPDTVQNDDKREEIALKVEDMAKALMLKNVVFTLGSKTDLDKYALEPNVPVTVILYRELKIEAADQLKDKLTDAKVNEIMKLVAVKLLVAPTRAK
jgi:hypothetical protein